MGTNEDFQTEPPQAPPTQPVSITPLAGNHILIVASESGVVVQAMLPVEDFQK
jgi:hypothetical protein